MGSLVEHFEKFILELQDSGADIDLLRAAGIVHANLDRVAGTVSAGGQRATMLVPILRRDLEEKDQPIPLVERPQRDPLPWSRLQTLKLGPFRGFRREEQFDLRKDVTLFYGPNGSGKTSLCEAIEFALTGDVEESSQKRFGSLDAYFKNIHEGRHLPPRLYSEGAGEGAEVDPDRELLQFAIIEKNRIESFARIAARTPGQANELIAVLFGLGAFTDFVANFAASIENKLALESPQSDTLERLKVGLEEAKRRLEISAEVQRGLDVEMSAVAREFRADCTIENLRMLLGEEQADAPSKLQELIASADEILPKQSGLRTGELRDIYRRYRRKRRELTLCEDRLKRNSGQLSYKRLFEAVQTVQQASTESCPACLTPLTQVSEDPYLRAKHELNLLQDLAALEAERAALQEQAIDLSGLIRSFIQKILRFDDNARELEGNPLSLWALRDQRVHLWHADEIGRADVRSLAIVMAHCEAEDKSIQLRADTKAQVILERDGLLGAQGKLAVLVGKRTQHEADALADKQLVEGFDEANADLVGRVAIEATGIAYEHRIKSAYGMFRDALIAYKDSLPERLLADLNELTKELYNSFNSDDHAGDQLAELFLPLRGGGKILVSFVASPENKHDALHILSEGHLRCLGLAILLAKNIKLGLPLIVFDDVVNAIDHDHRAGIRNTLFGDARINAKQIIVTCHGNEFIKDIQNQLGSGVSRLYVLNYHSGDHQPRVLEGSSRNYLTRASAALDEADQRQCLAFCRQALENIAAKIWKKLSGKSRDLGALTVPISPPTFKPELGALTKALLSKVESGSKANALTGDAWAAILSGLQEILIVPNSVLIWSYFNKGTHDEPDREDFELPAVKQTLAALQKISGVLAE